MTKLVESLRYRPEGPGFDSQWGHWDFSLDSFFQPHYGTGVDSVYNRNEYQGYVLWGKGGRCVGLTTLLPSCAEYVAILVGSTSCSPKSLSRPVME